MQTNLLTDWFRHFIACAKPTAARPVLLMLDGHSTHTKNVELIDLARENNVHIICLPPHCTNRLQPLDVSFMKPLSCYYDEAVRIWLRSHPGRVVTIHQIALLFRGAYLKAATAITAVNGFRKTGIVPFNPAVFNDADFAGSHPTDIANDMGDVRNPHQATATTTSPKAIATLPATSPATLPAATATTPTSKGPLPKLYVSSSDILPVPHVAGFQMRGTKRSRQTDSTAILTDSPHKVVLLAASAGSHSIKKKPPAKKRLTVVDTKKVRKPKTVIEPSSSESDESEPEVESEDEPSVQLIRRSAPMVDVGDYILVKFTKHRVSYYARKVVRVDRAGEIRTTFLKRNDMRKSVVAITFCWPEKSDLAWHDEDDVVEKLPEATSVGDTARTSDKLRFQFDFARFDSMLL